MIQNNSYNIKDISFLFKPFSLIIDIIDLSFIIDIIDKIFYEYRLFQGLLKS